MILPVQEISVTYRKLQATGGYMERSLFGPPGVRSFLQNTCTPNLNLSYAYIEGNETVTQGKNNSCSTPNLVLVTETIWSKPLAEILSAPMASAIIDVAS
jgi:hypothetical protein